MSQELGEYIWFVALNSGLFGRKPHTLEVHENGIVLKYKSEDKAYLFEQMSGIKSFDYYTDNPITYSFDIFNRDGKKIVTISVPFGRREDGTTLLTAHMNFLLKGGLLQNLESSDFELDDRLFWQRGKLLHKGKKGLETYTLSQIDEFVYKGGCYFFTLKDSKTTLSIFLQNTPNCLASIEVCKAIAAKASAL